MDDLQFIESDSGNDEEKLPSDARNRKTHERVKCVKFNYKRDLSVSCLMRPISLIRRKRIPQRGWPDVFEVNRATRSVLWCAGTRMVIESEQQ